MLDPNVAPINRNPIPVGTVEEAQSQGLDLGEYATCARPDRARGIMGCPFFGDCRVSAKGKAGPKNYGVQIMKGRSQGGGLVRTKVDCMWLAQYAKDYEANGGSVTVVAEEGEKFEVVTGVLVSNSSGQPTFHRDPNGHREKRRTEVEVPKFPRPSENPALLEDVLRAEVTELEKERRQDEARARSFGLADAITPLDKRDARGDGGRKASGGGKP